MTAFTLFLSQYLNEAMLDSLRNTEHIAPVCNMGGYQSLTCFIDYQYDTLYEQKENQDFLKAIKAEENGGEEKFKIIYEGFFAFAFMWSFCATAIEDRNAFSNSIKGMQKHNKFPDKGSCFDYYYDPREMAFKPWDDIVGKYEPDFEELFANIVVPTAETQRQGHIIDIHRKKLKGVLYIGNSGTGKTTVIKDYITRLDPENWSSAAINFNNYTDSLTLQTVIYANVDKRTGKIYGPAGGKKLVFFIDDLNMPKVDNFGSQPPICLVRQIIDYGITYNRDALEE